MKIVEIKNFKFGNDNPLVLIAGPCVVESTEMIFSTAERIKEITEKLDIPFIFKSSYKKANRTSIDSFIGIGDEEALKILEETKKQFEVPILTDVHSVEDVKKASDVADVIQIPAFLSRQTELLVCAGNSGKVINVKKGQFLAPGDMKYAADKITSTGNDKILLTERGTTFGYNNLVVDMRSLVIMRNLGYPVIMDAAHSVQIPSLGGKSGGVAEFIPYLSRAAAAVGIDGLFIETHPNPKQALSDAESQLPLNQLEPLLESVKEIDIMIKKRFIGVR
jgi:2-dehydro-3-deoxyphosphooctonate aldolase (KDO 8-P synthase)